MMALNLFLVCVGLVICFGGIYIRKICAGIMGLMWGAFLGFVIAVMMILSSSSIWYLKDNLQDDSTLLIVMIIAIIVCVLSAWLDRLCAAINAFLSGFFIFAMILCIFINDMEDISTIFILALIMAAVLAAMAYVYYKYAFIVVTAFSGAYIASIGGVGLSTGNDLSRVLYELFFENNGELFGIVIIATLILGGLGLYVQLQYFNVMNHMISQEKFHQTFTSIYKSFNVSFTVDPERLKTELAKDKRLFFAPVVAFLILPVADYYWSGYIVGWYVLFVLENVLIGIFLGGLVYSAVTNSMMFNMLYLLPYCVGQIVFYHRLFLYDIYGGIVSLLTYVLLWLVLKIVFTWMSDGKNVFALLTGIVFVWDTWVTTLLKNLSGSYLEGVNIYNILVAVSIVISVRYLYIVRIKTLELEQFSEKKRKALAVAVKELILAVVLGIAVLCFLNRTAIMYEFELLKESTKLTLFSDDEFEGYSGDLKEFATFLDGEWGGSNGSTLFFDTDMGQLTLTKDGEIHTYSHVQLEFRHSGVFNEPWLAERFNRNFDDESDYHRWVIQLSGEKEFFEIYCDYSWNEICWIYCEQTGEEWNEISAEYFYKEGENWDNKEEPETDIEESSSIEQVNPDILSLEEHIEKIREICNTIDADLDEMTVEDGGSDTTRYIDENGYIRLIIAEPGAYYDIDENIPRVKAYYFYDVIDGFEKACFVSIITEDGDNYRFYLIDNQSMDRVGNCIRYIDDNGYVIDYPDCVDPQDISDYGIFCHEASMEIHWAREGDNF